MVKPPPWMYSITGSSSREGAYRRAASGVPSAAGNVSSSTRSIGARLGSSISAA